MSLFDNIQKPAGEIKDKILAEEKASDYAGNLVENMESYYSQDKKDRSKLMNYFIANKLRNLTEHIGEF